ncbi:MAG: 50S ribosomal protein L11 methyltransferase [Anaerolineae bacterium]|nr:50S ribosomal protein L11 methyltransferase [Anaerolineae bacterium]MDK1081460.1 50S ribosomal protein L11 methyltransferase [Anaerolineae bacterium]
MKTWLEVSLSVDGEQAEAVADVLARFAPNGVLTEQGADYVDDEGQGMPSGPIIVRAYLEMNEQLEDTQQKLEESLFYLGMIQPLPKPTYKKIADQNWMEAWKQHYKPIPVGKRLIIVPVWLESPKPNRIPIKIDPGMAFGTGTHPSTQMALVLMENVFSSPPSIVIDVGCGSGILSIAALKLGAQTALGVDIDLESVKNASENAKNNGIGDEFIVGQGSVKEVLENKFHIKRAPLVVANILAPIIIRLFEDGLADLAEPGGRVILSGILLEQEPALLEAGQAKGLDLSERNQIEDWVGLSFVKS